MTDDIVSLTKWYSSGREADGAQRGSEDDVEARGVQQDRGANRTRHYVCFFAETSYKNFSE